MHTPIHAYIHTHTHTYIHTYIHTYTHTYIHPYMHTYIHTYIHVVGKMADSEQDEIENAPNIIASSTEQSTNMEKELNK